MAESSVHAIEAIGMEPTKSAPLVICFYCDRWPTFHPMHGPARYVQTLARALVKMGVSVHVVTAEPGPSQRLEEEGYTLHTVDLKPFPFLSRFQAGIGESLGLYRFLRGFVREFDVDIVEFTNVEGVAFFTSLFRLRPTVVRVHTTAFDALRIGAGTRRLEAHYARLERWTASVSTKLVTHSESHRCQAAEDYGVPIESIAIVPHGIDPIPQSADIVRQPNQILAVGQASTRKGVNLFLEIASRLTATHPDLKFLWIGADTRTSPTRTLWREYAEEAFPHLVGKLAFRSGLTDQEIADLYAASTCYLCTAQYESFGLTLVEAMMAGLPVIAPRTAAMGDIISDGRSGWLFSAGVVDEAVDVVEHALTSPSEREFVANTAMRVAQEEYSVTKMATRMRELYDAVR